MIEDTYCLPVNTVEYTAEPVARGHSKSVPTSLMKGVPSSQVHFNAKLINAIWFTKNRIHLRHSTDVLSSQVLLYIPTNK